MQQYYEQGKLEIGLDEAGRGSLMGPVFIGAVIMNDINDYPPPYEIKDSKKCSPNVRAVLRKYIEDNSIAHCVEYIDVERIDKVNILEATMEGMEKCVDNITSVLNVDRLLVDGNTFHTYMDKFNLSLTRLSCKLFITLTKRATKTNPDRILNKILQFIYHQL